MDQFDFYSEDPNRRRAYLAAAKKQRDETSWRKIAAVFGICLIAAYGVYVVAVLLGAPFLT